VKLIPTNVVEKKAEQMHKSSSKDEMLFWFEEKLPDVISETPDFVLQQSF